MFHFVALKGNEMKQTLKQQLTITREQRNKYYLKQIQKLSEEREVLYMERFPDENHLSSYCGVSPGNNESAGKKKVQRP
ncbi:Mobile element protein [Mucinivorans hirudinis]|uniref:Mobile element protein n=1 Tax=Mucinivorans hirudinis TaxID=1433126 RepID=A0A060RAM4_9BACT|nr:Mobile element protein [Mucinivorans hirudinis]